MFTIEEVYGCSRDQYLAITQTTPEEMVERLENEVLQLRRSHAENTAKLNHFMVTTGTHYGSNLMHLIQYIEAKIHRKTIKIKDIKKEFDL